MFFRVLWPRTLRAQISLFLICVTLVGSSLFTWFTGRQQANLIRHNIKQTGTALVENLAFDASNRLLGKDYASLEVLTLQYGSLPEITRVRVFDARAILVSHIIRENGAVKISYAPISETLPPELEVMTGNEAVYFENDKNLTIWKTLSVSGKRIGYVNLDLSLAQMTSVQSQLLRNSLSFGVVAIFAGLFLIFVYLRKPLSAIKSASNFALALDENLGRQLPVETSAKELEDLGTSLNEVSKRLYLQEERLRESEKHLQTVLSNAVDGIIALDKHLNMVSVNPSAERLFGYLSQSIIGKPIQLLFETPMDFLKAEGTSAEHRIQLRGLSQGGKSFVAELSKSQVDLDKGRLYVLIVRDITERLRYETALRRSEEEAKKLSLVASRTNNAVIITDKNGCIEWVNEGFTRITGYALREVLGSKPGSFLQGPNTDRNTLAAMRQALKNQEGFKGEILNYSKTNQAYWLELEIQPIFSSSGGISNYIAIESDITERIRANEALQEAVAEAKAANRAKSEFLSRMSHELRTPLNAILGFGQILTTEDLDENQLDSAQHIIKAGSHLLQLIDEVLDISRIEVGSMQMLDEQVVLAEVIHDAFALVSGLAKEKEVKFDFSFEDDYGVIRGDSQRLKQIFINLFSNAIKYNQTSGKVFVSYKRLPNNVCQCIVQDTGIGISDENLKRLFVPFDRLGAEKTNIEGVGIGLALTKSLVEAIGGTLQVNSKLGEGTSFTLSFSKVEVDSVPQPRQAKAVSQGLESLDSRMEIVYIEDNESNISLLKKLFSNYEQLKLHVANNAIEGLKLSQIIIPDLLLLDLNLPDLSGEEVLQRFKADPELSHIPIIILSADATRERIQQLIAQGAHAYITKPLMIEELFKAIGTTLEPVTKSVDLV